ncbi:MAG: hypothetical protein AAB897_00380 [Patescibacteria group bacterium]
MIIFLYGPDDYRRAERKKFYIAEFKKKYSGLSLDYFDLENPEALERLETFLRSQSLFEKKKLAVLENALEADEKKLVEILKSIAGDPAAIVAISESKKPAGALKFIVNAPKPSVSEEFEHLAGAEWDLFIRKEAKSRLRRQSDDGVAEARGVVLAPAAANFLAEVYAKNSWGLVTELDKLSNLDKKEISRADLEALGLETVPNYWMMVNSAKSQNLKTRLWALEKLFSQKDPPAKIFNILASLWRERIPQMAEYDFMVKSGKLEYEEVLLDTII